jgi:hypothetical protein
MYVQGYLQGSENGRVVTIDYLVHMRGQNQDGVIMYIQREIINMVLLT